MPKPTPLFYFYAVINALWLPILVYVITVRIGSETEQNYLRFIEMEVCDTISNLEKLDSRDRGYPHSGLIHAMQLKKSPDFFVALYVRPQKYEDKIYPGNLVLKNAGSNSFRVISSTNEYSFELKDLVQLRINALWIMSIIFFIAYIVFGLFILFVPIGSK